MRGLNSVTTAEATPPRTCICGCGRSFDAGKHGRKYFDTRPGSACRKKVWESRWLRRRPARRNTGSVVPCERLPKRPRTYCRTRIEPGCIRKALKLLASTRPDIFVELLASVSAVETTARQRIDLAG